MQFRILGSTEVLADGRSLSMPSGQQRALLAVLLLHANRVLTPEQLADALWGEELPATGTKALAFHVSRLRDVLAPGRRPGSPAGGLETADGGYLLRVDPDDVDALRFERLAREGHRDLGTDPASARASLLEALALWRGDAFADVACMEAIQPEIRRLDELRLRAREDLLDAELALGRHVEAAGELETLVEENPLRERLRCLLMLALYRSGRQAEALRAAGAGRRVLSEELGIDPSPELVQLEHRILAQDPDIEWHADASPARRTRNPYKGLRPFLESDAGDFFGREALIARLVARLEEVTRQGRLLAVVGPSGSGKSSVVRAGLIPALRDAPGGDGRPWRIATMVPGTEPVRELAAGLAAGLAADGLTIDPNALDRALEMGDPCLLLQPAAAPGMGRLLLVVDQLEELFLRVPEAPRSAFLRGLAAMLSTPLPDVVVIATLRADFLHLPLAIPDIGGRIRDGIELVTPLSSRELERAIELPARAVGVEVEPGLTLTIAADVEHHAGGLPLLQYALSELFDRMEGRRLTRLGYEAIGGALGALGRKADEAWSSLDPGQRQLAKQLFLGLASLGDDGVVIGRRVPRAELLSLTSEPGAAEVVLDLLGQCGLLTFDRDPVRGAAVVQVAHEALLVHWSRLADWVEDLREDLWTRRRLAEAAAEWEARGHATGYLAADARLDLFEAWAGETRIRLGGAERSYLAASVAERDRVAGLEAARTSREHRLERRAGLVRRLFVGVLIVALVVTGGLSAALYGQGQGAIEQAEISSARALAAGSIASLGRGAELSVLLALQAADATAARGYVMEEAYDALQWALQSGGVAFPRGSLPVAVRGAPDGPHGIFVVSPGELIRLGREFVHRPLSADECRAYLHLDACPAGADVGNGNAVGIRTNNGVVPAAAFAFGPLVGTEVRVLSELPSEATSALAGFAAATGIQVQWEAASEGSLPGRLEAGDVPDLAIVAQPASLAAAAAQGSLLEVDGLADTAAVLAAAGDYATGLDRITLPGSPGIRRQVGIPLAASLDDLLWYPDAAFTAAGYEPPTTAAELEDLVSQLRADGHVPWCLGLAGARPGSAAAAWIEDLVLHEQDPAVYDRWVAGEVATGSTTIRSVVEEFGEIVMRDGDVLNGLDAALITPDRIAALPMVAFETPECWLYRGSSTDREFLTASRRDSAAAVRFPMGSGTDALALGRVYSLVALRDRPEVRTLAAWLSGAAGASSLAPSLCRAGIFPVRGSADVAACTSPPEAARLQAAMAAAAFRVRAQDLFPPEVSEAFLADINGFLSRWKTDGPSTRDMGFATDGAWLAWHASDGT